MLEFFLLCFLHFYFWTFLRGTNECLERSFLDRLFFEQFLYNNVHARALFFCNSFCLRKSPLA